MPIKFNAVKLLGFPACVVPITELEALGTGGWSCAVWHFRDLNRQNAGNIGEFWTFLHGSSTGTGFGSSANSGKQYHAVVGRNDDSTGNFQSSDVDTTTSDSLAGQHMMGAWAGSVFATTADPADLGAWGSWSAVDKAWHANNSPYTTGARSGGWSTDGDRLGIAMSQYWGWPGALAHIQLWKRTLAQDEMQQALREPGSVRDGLTLWLPMERDFRDLGPLGRHGTFVVNKRLGNAQYPFRRPSTSDGSGLGGVPALPSIVRPRRSRHNFIAFESGTSGSVPSQVSAAGTATLPHLTASGTGATLAKASGAATLPHLTASGTAKATTRAQGVVTLPHLTAGGAATAPVRASGTAQLPRLQTSGTAVRGVTVTAQGRATLPALSASGAAQVLARGAGAAILPHLLGGGQSRVLAQGVGLARLPMFVTSGRGYALPVGAQIGELEAILNILPALTGSTTVRPRLIGTVAIRPILTGTVRI